MDRALRPRRPGVRGAVLVAAVALLATGCVSKKAFVAKSQELDAATAALAKERERAADLDAQLAAARGEVARLTSQLAEVSSQRETLARQLALVQESASQKDVSIRQLTTRYDALIKDLERQKSELAARTSDLSGRLAEAESQLASLTAERQRLQVDLDALRATLGETQAQLAERERALRETTATYDKLVADLKGEIAEGQVQITQLRDRLTVNLVDKILFDSGSIVIKPRGREVLQKVAEVLRTVSDKRIQIEGHTDNVPIAPSLQSRFPTNWELAAARATAVARFLQDEGGVDPTRLVATGYGEYHPVASNDTPEGRAQNRRIEIVLVPLTLEAAVQ